MTFTEVRAKLQEALHRIPEEEEVVRDAKRRIFDLFKAVKKPEAIVIKDTAEVTRLEREVTRLDTETRRLRTEMSAAIQKERDIDAKARVNEVLQRIDATLEGVLSALSLCDATEEQIARTFRYWWRFWATFLEIAPDDSGPFFFDLLTRHLTAFAEHNGVDAFVNSAHAALTSEWRAWKVRFDKRCYHATPIA